MYYAQNGSYPSTGGISAVYSDSNCSFAEDLDGKKTAQWVPGITETLPQNPGLDGTGVSGSNSKGGYYLYSSNGTSYILSAWNAKRGGASTDIMYRRIGYRESGNFGDNYYTCNLKTFVGASDFYKNSYTVSNVTSCNETPPSGS